MKYASDVIGFGVSAVIIGLYHLYLYRRVQRNPAYTVQAVNHVVRTAWVAQIMADAAKAGLGKLGFVTDPRTQ